MLSDVNGHNFLSMLYKLHVKVIEADDIPKMDANATDAYCILSTSSEKCSTFAIMNTMHPKWEQDFFFTVSTPASGSLRIKMRDKDKIKDDLQSKFNILRFLLANLSINGTI